MSRTVEIIKAAAPVIGMVAVLVGVAFVIGKFSRRFNGVGVRLMRAASNQQVSHSYSGLLISALLAVILLLPVYDDTYVLGTWLRWVLMLFVIVETTRLFKNLSMDGRFKVVSALYAVLVISTLLAAILLLYEVRFVPHKATRLVLLFVVTVESVKRFKYLFLDGKYGALVSRAALSLLSAFVLLLILEACFMFLPLSHGVGYTLGGQLWLSTYWKPVNHYGYRDTEPDDGKPVILFVGDSFTAGQGIEDANDRFSDLVRRELRQPNKNVSVVNMGINGADTRAEFHAMKTLVEEQNIKPKTIVLQYYGNDIEQAAVEHGLKFPGFAPYTEFPAFCKPLIEGSYLLDYIYWLYPRKDFKPLVDFMTRLYSNEAVLKTHERDLQQFIAYANERSIQLIVLVFPFMVDIERSRETYVGKMVHFFNTNHVTTIDVSALIEDWPVRERVVNRNDSHASTQVQKVVAREILKYIN